jgi:hypothetical protein
MGVACKAHVGEEGACRNLVETPEGKRPLGRPRRRWVDKNKIDLRKIEWDGIDWIERQVEGSCEHGNEPWGSIKCR